jgi:malate dehydrogenase (oxaloacetate-decarboxylating)(NADP+)
VEAIGPILTGVDAAVHVLQRGVDVNDIVNISALCALKAQRWQE